MRLKFFLTVLYWIISIHLNGSIQDQQLTISGVVTDNKGIPLPGATVLLKGTSSGAYTAADGSYSLSLKGEAGKEIVLFCSYIGYQSEEKVLNAVTDTYVAFSLSSTEIMTGEVFINASRAGRNTPLAYVNIDREDISRMNMGHDLPFVLGLTPSLVETSEAGNGIGYTSMRIRGSDGSRINVTIDGIPLNDPESQQVFWVDLPDLASSVESIQVQRGVGTSTNGAGAFGATISIETRNPENEPYAALGFSGGSYGTLKTTVETGTGLLKDRFAMQMRLSGLRSDGYIDRTGSEHQSAFLSGVYRNGPSRLKMNLILGKEHTGIGWWGVPADRISSDRRYNPAGEYTGNDGEIKFYGNESDNYTQNHLQLIYSNQLSTRISLNSTFHYTKGKGYYEEYKEDEKHEDYGLQPADAGGLIFDITDLIRRKWMSNDFAGLSATLKYKTEKLEIVSGSAINRYDGDHFGKIIWMEHPGVTEKDHRWYFNTGIKNEGSLFSKADYSLNKTVSVFGDLQLRYIDYEMKGLDDDLRDLGQRHGYLFFNPKAGVFLNFPEKQEGWFSVAVANREPTRADFKEAAGDPLAIPEPERLIDIETGYRYTGAKALISANLYGMFYHNQLVPTGELSNVGYPIMTNVQESYRTGLELTAGFKPSAIVSFNGNLTLSRNKITDFVEHYTDYNTADWSKQYLEKNLGTVDIAYSPSVIFMSEIRVTPLDVLELSFLSKYTGSQYFDNTMSSDRMLDPYFVNNLMIDFKPEIKRVESFNIQLLVNNIFNNQYISNAYGGNWYEDGQEMTWAYYFPQAGINYMVRLNVLF